VKKKNLQNLKRITEFLKKKIAPSYQSYRFRIRKKTYSKSRIKESKRILILINKTNFIECFPNIDRDTDCPLEHRQSSGDSLREILEVANKL
jgi:hypothetical protein